MTPQAEDQAFLWSELNMENQRKFIDVREVIHSKNPRLLKVLPSFIINYIRKILHEDEVNFAIDTFRDRQGVEFVKSILSEFGATITSRGLENIPKSGPLTIAANHPLGGLDGLALMQEVAKVRPDLKFLANDILMNLHNLKELFIPVNKVGKSGGDVFLRIESAYMDNRPVLIFPAGLVSRKQPEGIRDLEWKRSFIINAKKYKIQTVPCHIEGMNSAFFYNLAYWRKKLGIKVNIEMFYLVDEMYKQKKKEVKLTFGKPISHEVFDDSRSEKEWAATLKKHVYLLGKGEDLPLKSI